jgi:hypothetical protein
MNNDSTETIRWITVSPMSLPDADANVLLGLSDGFSCEGFLDDGSWRDVTGLEIDGAKVVAWADLPPCRVTA